MVAGGNGAAGRGDGDLDITVGEAWYAPKGA